MSSAYYTPSERTIRSCLVCHSDFIGYKSNQTCCSRKCFQKKYWHSKGSANRTTANIYARNNGRFDLYFRGLLAGRPDRKELSVTDLLLLLDRQGHKCALTGTAMTCSRTLKYHNPTNASIDRIVAGGPYSLSNIQLVCTAVNKFRADLTKEDFINWCKKVVEYNG
jgi:hypothetical protein